jgi:polyisoprenoid-binding protein YceI
MKQSQRILTLAFAALTLAAAAATAAPEPLNLDVAHTNVGFTIRHFFSRVSGRFAEFSGTIQYDPQDVPASSVEVSITSKSITTENERRDNHLRSADFFNVDSFPTLTFKSSKVVLDGGKTTLKEGDKFKILGDLTIKGISKPVTLDATFTGSGPVGIGGNAMGTIAGFEATTTVNRKDFNILWNRVLDQGGTMLGDDVTINLVVEAHSPPPTKK